MTDRLWNYLETELTTTDSYLEIETDMGKFVVEPVYWEGVDHVIDFVVYHGSYATNCKEEPDIWFWEEIESHIFN